MQLLSRIAPVPIAVLAFALLGAAKTIHVPTQTPVTVHVVNDISSAKANVGDAVPILVAEDVVVGGYVVIAKSADGMAKVAGVTPATSSAPGQVQLSFVWVRAVDGSRIGIVGVQEGVGRAGSSAADATSTLYDTGNAASSVGASQASGVLGGAQSLMGIFAKHARQNDASVSQKQAISVAVKNPNGVTIASSQKAATDDSDIK